MTPAESYVVRMREHIRQYGTQTMPLFAPPQKRYVSFNEAWAAAYYPPFVGEESSPVVGEEEEESDSSPVLGEEEEKSDASDAECMGKG